MIIKKIGTSQLGKMASEAERPARREDETNSLEALRTSLGTGSTMDRGILLEGRYEIEQVIGYGGMSTVYRARDTRFTHTVRVCAVKEMFDVSTDPAVRQDKLKRFEEEANYLALLNHTAIPKIYDFFEANDRRYLVLEFIEGKNLENVLEENKAPLDEKQVLEWGVLLCDVLAYLHGHKPRPIVFRDMKPSNVMITKEGRLVLIDFGIAKTFQEDKKGTMIGTEGYSPPEQYKGLALPSGDIYALGATMHQLLTNSDPRVEVPFTFHQRMPRVLNPSISAETEKIVMKALEYDIPKRWATVEEFRDALLQVLSKLGSNSMLVRSSAPVGTSTRNLGSEVFADVNSSIAAARAAGLTGENPTLTRSNSTKGNLANRSRQSSSSDVEIEGLTEDVPEAKLIWSFATEEEVRSTPVVSNGAVYIGSYDSNLYALDAQNGSFLWKAATEAGICTTPCITDKMVLVGSEDSSLYAFDAARGKQIWTVRTGGPIRSSARYYAPMLFFGSDDYYIYCVEARTGKQVWKQRTWGQVRSTPAVVGGVVYVGSTDGNLYAIDGNNGNVKWKFRAQESIVSSPTIIENLLFVGSQDNNFYCIDSSNGGWKLWQFKTGSYVSSSPVVHNGRVYFGSVDGYLYCLETKNGRLVWKFNTGKQVTSSPRIAEGTVVFGGIDGIVYALDAEKGTPRWYYSTEGPIPSSPAIENGIVYIGSIDYHVYALSLR
ncbi:MAG TPA: PQQ-binding-like beta-propeller repeat protein [Chloroflexia bacterium]|nr:PQQ-binding-like beta-propeller repeat protein [Chloroflexia bacterium]